MRQRKQKEVSKENDFYMQLLQQALPVQQEILHIPVPVNSTSPDKSKGKDTVLLERNLLMTECLSLVYLSK